MTIYTSSGDDNNQENITIYGYYFVETRSNPTGYAADFYAHGSWTGDTGTEAGTAAQRIYSSGSSIDAVNEEAPQLVVKKRWRGVPDTTGYPEIKFQLWCGYREGNVVTVNSNQTWPYKNQNGEIYEITLNEDNDWTWVCPEDLPAKGASPDNQTYFTDVGYFVKEILPDQNDRTIGGTTWNFYQYVNDKGNAYNSVNQGGKAGIVANDKGNIEGTITIVNAVNDYFQMDIKKQFFMIHDDGAWDNVTAQTGMKDTVLGFRVLRRIVFPDNSKSGWMDYGDEMFVGFDHDGHTVMDNGSNDFYLEYGGSDWHFRIRDESHLTDTGDLSGLPKRGYYVNDAGETIGVKYEYCYRETGVYKDLNKTPYPDWEWYSTITPDRYISENGQTGEFGIAFPNQDGERVANYQASNILINKRWAGEPNAREVYINIYRKAGANGEAEDFTKIIADDVAGRYPENHPAYGNSNWQHYVDDTSIVDTTKNYLILKSNSSGDWTTTVNIYNALIGEAGENTGSHYTYWIQEIGYKDKNGTVHMLSETDDLDELETHYNHWVNGVFGAWIERGDPNWLDNAIRINEKDTNKLLTVNVPEMNMTVNKEWFDINGDPTEPWQDTITFQIEQVSTKYNAAGEPTGETRTALIKIDGDDTFTIYKDYGTNRDINVNHNAHDQYTTEGDVQTYGAPWTFYIDGLQEGYFDDNHDEWHCTYNIKEVNVIKSEVTILGNGVSSDGKTVLIENKYSNTGSVKIAKTFSGIDALPENFKIIASWTDANGAHEINLKVNGRQPENVTLSGNGSAGYPYVWTISKIPVPNETDAVPIKITFTESGFEAGEINVTVSSPTDDSVSNEHPTTAVEVSADEIRRADFVNIYSSGSADIKLLKIDGSDKKPLGGARFSMYRCDTEDGTYTLMTEINGVELDENSWFTVPEEGLTISGLTQGFYKIEENDAPAGYVIVDKTPIRFEIGAGGKITNNSIPGVVYDSAENLFTIPNTPGAELPSTGGPGTLLYTLSGILLMLGAALMYGFRMRRRERRLN